MTLGGFVRRSFGRHERWVSEVYRSIFVDIDKFGAQLHAWAPDARRILEVGCGEGAVSERLAAAFPDAEITGIDITPAVGRQYAGPAGRVRFIQQTAQALAEVEPGRYDFVILADVLHHVPEAIRDELLDAIRRLVAPGGRFVMKEWERDYSPIYWLSYLSDRWITGDRIRYLTREEGQRQIDRAFGAGKRVAEARIAPWRVNIATLVHA